MGQVPQLQACTVLYSGTGHACFPGCLTGCLTATWPHLAVKGVKQWVVAGRDVPAASEAVEVKALVQGTVGRHWVQALVCTLGHTLLVADCTGIEGVYCLVTIQVTTPAHMRGAHTGREAGVVVGWFLCGRIATGLCLLSSPAGCNLYCENWWQCSSRCDQNAGWAGLMRCRCWRHNEDTC